MKIESNKNNNINEKVKETLKAFHKKQILLNIKYHKIFIIFMILINITLIYFIFVYKAKIKKIKNFTKNHFSKIENKNKELSGNNSTLSHKLVNIAAQGVKGLTRLSLIFEKSEEFNSVKRLIYDYKEKKGDFKIEFEKRIVFFLYQNVVDSDDYNSFMNAIAFFGNIFIFIETKEGNKFGIYHRKHVIRNDNNEFESNSTDILLYSFETKKLYDFVGDKNKSLAFKNDKLLILGDDELVIYNNFCKNGGYVNYPLKSFDLSNKNKNILTGKNGKFSIKFLEVFYFTDFY